MKKLTLLKCLSVSAIIFLVIPFSHAQNLYNVVGTGDYGYNGDNLAPLSTQIVNPNNVAFDAEGNMYFADYGNSVIRKLTISTGLITKIAGVPNVYDYNGDYIAADTAMLNYPCGITLDTAGNIYFTEYYGHRVRKITVSTGLITTIAGNGTAGYNADNILAVAAQLNSPYGIVINKYGDIYITENGGNRVRKIDHSIGLITTIAGTGLNGWIGDSVLATSANISYLAGIALDTAGNIYLSAEGENRIAKVDISTGYITSIAGYTNPLTFGMPGYNGDNIPADSATLFFPYGVALDDSGNVYIADENNNRIRKVTKATGIITTIAGSGTAGYNGDSLLATNSQLNTPQGVSFDNHGHLYICDDVNGRIRKIFKPCTGVVAGSITNSADYLCGTGNDTLTLNGTPVAEDIIYQWMMSPDGINYSNVGTGDNTYVTGGIGNTTYYKVLVTCTANNTADSTVVDSIAVVTLNTSTISIIASPGTNISSGTAVTFTATITNAGYGNTFQWLKNNAIIAGATNTVYTTNTLVDNDNITCVVQRSDTCAPEFTANSNALVIHVSSGVEQISTSKDREIVVYPNPNNGIFTIDGGESGGGPVQIEILNMIGQVIDRFNAAVNGGRFHEQLSLRAETADGIYLLRVKTGDANNSVRFLIHNKQQ